VCRAFRSAAFWTCSDLEQRVTTFTAGWDDGSKLRFEFVRVPSTEWSLDVHGMDGALLASFSSEQDALPGLNNRSASVLYVGKCKLTYTDLSYRTSLGFVARVTGTVRPGQHGRRESVEVELSGSAGTSSVRQLNKVVSTVLPKAVRNTANWYARLSGAEQENEYHVDNEGVVDVLSDVRGGLSCLTNSAFVVVVVGICVLCLSSVDVFTCCKLCVGGNVQEPLQHEAPVQAGQWLRVVHVGWRRHHHIVL